MIDIIIIGAGPSGLCAAKTFLQYDAQAEILILDANSTLGGVWSKERIYPTLKTNNLRGGNDFTDLAVDDSFGVREGEHITGDVMHTFLCAYADKFHVTDKIRYNTKVVEVRRMGDGTGWAVEVEAGHEDGEVLECRKLVVATGILSVPHQPTIKGADSFDAPIIHSSDLGGKAADTLLHHPDAVVRKVAVLGGSKSAYDAVYLAATTGHEVEWIIRRSGRGPAWVFPPHTYLGPFKTWKERLPVRRIVSFMSPWVFPDFSGWGWLRRFLHFNLIGKLISDAFVSIIHHDTIRDCGYQTDERFKILQPEANPIWYGTQSGTLSFDTDFFDLIRNGQVSIHREDIDHLSSQAVHLSNGRTLRVDALITATGFSSKPTISFAPSSLHSELGLPTTCLDKQQKAIWAKFDTQADWVIAGQYPGLLQGPTRPHSQKQKQQQQQQYQHTGVNSEVPYTPWRLYRGIAPPGLTAEGDRSLVFIGMFSNITNTIRMEIQCLWAMAYMMGKLDNTIPGVSSSSGGGGYNDNVDNDHGTKIFRETALWQRFTRHRAPYGHGPLYPDLVFDQVPYWDLLLHDLGLETRRKGGLRELFEPYTEKDYQGIVDEWARKNR